MKTDPIEMQTTCKLEDLNHVPHIQKAPLCGSDRPEGAVIPSPASDQHQGIPRTEIVAGQDMPE